MLIQFFKGMIGGAVERSLITAAQLQGEIPVPDGVPLVHAGGADPHRILMLGAGVVRGIGVASYDLGIGGHLARRLSTLTGSGVDVELAGSVRVRTANSLDLIAATDLSRLDAVVLMLGTFEATTLSSPRNWRRDIRAVLDELAQRLPATCTVFVVGVPRIDGVIPIGRRTRVLVDGHVDLINAVTSDECIGRERVEFVPFFPRSTGDLERFGDTFTYFAWSEPIAAAMFGTLAQTGADPRALVLSDEEFRQASLDALGVFERGPDPEMDAISGIAKDLFGVAAAHVSFLDHDRMRMHASAGIEHVDVDRSDSFCDVTMALGRLHTIADVLQDPVASKLTGAAMGIRFYAGYPLEAPNGQLVGTLCIIDSRPRTFTSKDASLLRELALRVQAALWHRTKVPA